MKLKRKSQTSTSEESNTPEPEKKVDRKSSPKKVELTDEEKMVQYQIPELLRPDVTPRSFPGSLDERPGSVSYTITLDAPTFRYVWEAIEGKAKRDHYRRHGIKVFDHVTRHAVNAFRNSYAHAHGIEPPTKKKLVAKKTGKSLKRKAA